MNYNVGAYIIYLLSMVFIIGYVGRYFYTNGRIFILTLLNGNATLTDHINKLLLVAYYLFNIGYTFLKLKQWQKITSIEALLSSLASNMGVLILILAFTHYLNMLVIYFLSKSNYITHKSLSS
ncbi:MAG: hypothetical protein EON98_13590 [Chitinophagaceae bacterium]|nr:MAG: hypothetical protein EON98_13590 [Chitinophagaceae bacterium]